MSGGFYEPTGGWSVGLERGGYGRSANRSTAPCGRVTGNEPGRESQEQAITRSEVARERLARTRDERGDERGEELRQTRKRQNEKAKAKGKAKVPEINPAKERRPKKPDEVSKSIKREALLRAKGKTAEASAEAHRRKGLVQVAEAERMRNEDKESEDDYEDPRPTRRRRHS